MIARRSIIDTAQLAIAEGLCVVPPREDGTKAPDAPSWKEFQSRRPTRDELNAWYKGNQRHGIGLVCGEISGGLELFEFEHAAIEQGMDARLFEIMRDIGEETLANRLLDGYVERSASGGLHFLYRCPVTRSEKLASTSEHRTLIETKGEGGYVIVAPSHGPVSPHDGAWEQVTGTLASIPAITPDERATLHRVARLLDQTPTPELRYTRPTSSDQPSPLDLYRDDPAITEHTVQLLEKHGWSRAGQSGETIYLRRPGKTQGISATVGHIAPGVTTIFTTSTLLDARTYSPGDLYAHLEHAGDIAQATRALRDHGYAPPIDRTTPVIQAPPVLPTAPGEHQDHDGPELTGWEPIDLAPIWAGETVDQPPTILTRTDGLALVYPGKVNTFQGESESMKTWAALCAAAELLAQGLPVIYIDFEDSPTTIVERLRLLGVPPDAPLIYMRPDNPFTLEARDQLATLLAELEPALVILDGVTEAMTAEGLDLMSNADIARWMKTLPRWIARTPCAPAVITIDHVPKNPDARGKGAIGGQHKRAGIDGIGLTFTVGSEPLARGRDGRARITIDKDRPGHARAHSVGKSHIGDLVITHFADQLTWHIEPADDEPQDTRQSLAETILGILQATDGPWSIRGLSTELRNQQHSHANEAITNTLEMLAREGKVESIKGPNGYPQWRLSGTQLSDFDPVDNS
jgi:hypothetical protein